MKLLKQTVAKLVPHLVPILCILLVVFIFFWKYFLRGLVPIPADFIVGTYYPWLDYVWESYSAGVPVKNPLLADVPSLIYPLRAYAAEIMRSGQVPLWNNLQFGGYPLLANFQSAVLYPLNIFYFLINTVDAWSIQVILQPLFACIFMYLFLVELRLSKLASLLGSFVYAFSGFNVIFLEYNVHGHVAAFIPLILLLIDKYIKTSRLFLLVLLSISIAIQIFAGYPQLTFYTLLLALGWAIFRLGIRDIFLQKKKVIFVCLFLGLGLLLSSVQILPGLELLFLSQRTTEGAAGGIDVAYLPWLKLITLVAPDFFGNPSTYNYWGPGDYTTTVGYSGVIPLLLCVVAFVKRRKSVKKFFLLTGLLSLFFALPNPVSYFVSSSGAFGTGAALATRVLVLFNLSVAVLCAYGLDALTRTKFVVSDFIRTVRVFCLTVFTFFVPFLVWYFLGGIKESYIFPSFSNMEINLRVVTRNIVLPTLFLSFSVVLVFARAKFQRITKLIAILLFVTTTAELFRFGWKYTPFSKRGFVYPTTPVLEFLQGREKPFRFSEGDVIPISMWMPYRLESASGYDAVYPESWAKYLSVVNTGNPNAAPMGRYGSIYSYSSPLLDLANVKYVISLKRNKQALPDQDGQVSYKLRGEKFEKVYEDRTVVVLENKKALPRAFLVADWEVLKQDEVLPKLLESNFPIDRKIILTEDFDGFVQSQGTLESKLDYLEYSYKNYKIVTNSNQNAFLFVSDSWYPGWKAFVDGNETKIYQADYTFRAIPVERGKHTVEFIYDPISFRIGKWLSMATIIFLLIVLVYDKNAKDSRRAS